MDFSSITQSKNEKETDEEILGDFVLSASQCLNKISSNALRSHINILCGDILRMKSLTSGSGKKEKKRQNCEYCQTPWKYGHFSIKVVPFAKMGKKMRQIVRKIAQNKKVADVQRKLAEFADFRHKIIAKCHICTKSSIIKAKGRKKEKTNSKKKNDCNKIIQAAKMIPNIQERQKKKKKKKKKKEENKFCGLNIGIMKQLNGSTNKSENSSEAKLTDTKGNNDEDNDIVVISYTPNIEKSKKKSLKMKTENSSVSISTLEFKTKNICKRKKSKPLPISSVNSRTSSPDVVPLDNITPINQKVNRKKNKYDIKFPKENQVPSHVNKRRKLNHWKKLMREEEEKPLISRNLVDFLSTL